MDTCEHHPEIVSQVAKAQAKANEALAAAKAGESKLASEIAERKESDATTARAVASLQEEFKRIWWKMGALAGALAWLLMQVRSGR